MICPFNRILYTIVIINYLIDMYSNFMNEAQLLINEQKELFIFPGNEIRLILC